MNRSRPLWAAAVLAAVCSTSRAPAQEPSQTELRQRREAKLAEPVFAKAAWRTDFEAAQKEAKTQGKLILAYFTRSYAH